MRGARVADGRREIVGERFLRGAEARTDAAHGAGVHAGHDDRRHLVGGELGRLECRVPRLLDEWAVLDLAEAFLPLARTGRARSAPPLDELFGRARGAEVLRDHGAVGIVADEEGGPAVAGRRLVAARRQAGAQIGCDEQDRTVAVERGAQRADSRPQGATEVERRDVGVEPQRGVHGRRVVLVEIRGLGRREPQRVRRRVSGRAPQRERAASTPIVVVSSSYDATERVPLPPPLPNVFAISARCRRQYGT